LAWDKGIYWREGGAATVGGGGLSEGFFGIGASQECQVPALAAVHVVKESRGPLSPDSIHAGIFL
jgi:hypothetical protein